MIRPQGGTTWPLVPFERYMLDDDLPAAPMTFTVTWRIEGPVAPDRLRAALDLALVSHPLLACRVAGDAWVPAPGGVPFRCLPPAAAPAIATKRLDVAHDAALDAVLVDGGDTSEFRLTFHHAACDGIGAMEFCGDVFAHYRGDAPAARRADPALLADRRRLERPEVVDATWLDAVRHFAGEGWRFLADQAVAIPCGPAEPATTPPAALHPVRLSCGETSALRRRATAQGATLNELLLGVLVSAIARHCGAAAASRRDAWLGVVQPVSLRPPRPARLPACNCIGYAFLRRPLAACDTWERLLPGIVSDGQAIARFGLAACFNDALRLICRLPGPLRRRLIRAMRPGTFIFSYLGDPVRRFSRGLRGAAGGSAADGTAVIDLGGCRVVDFSGAPPPRPGTELAILASLFGQRLTLWLRPSAALAAAPNWSPLAAEIDAAVRALLDAEPVGTAAFSRRGRP
jgi:hypothetical protein